MAICTDAERKLLDAMWDSFRGESLFGCPYCAYDGLGPASKGIDAAMRLVVDEGVVFTKDESIEILRSAGFGALQADRKGVQP